MNADQPSENQTNDQDLGDDFDKATTQLFKFSEDEDELAFTDYVQKSPTRK